jgi:glycosyltransferase involved in cell wall biosynthesis
MNISVVICTYTEKRWDTLVAAITSVQQQSLPPYQIIVVSDNNPVIAACLRACSSCFPGIIVAEHTGTPGISGARNEGVALAAGDIVAFIDDDAVADEDWLFRLAQHYEDRRVLGVGGKVLPQWTGKRPRWFPAEFDWVVGCSYRGLPHRARPVRNFIGCNMSFRREVLAAIDGFQDTLGRIAAHPVGCEETDLCIRICQHWPDGILLYDPRAVVRQIVPASRENWRYFLSRCFFEGRSKAILARLVGSRAGLSAERRYTLQTLPSGILLGLYDSIAHRDWYGIARASAIVAGLLYTTAGYLVASITPAVSRMKKPDPTSSQDDDSPLRSGSKEPGKAAIPG